MHTTGVRRAASAAIAAALAAALGLGLAGCGEKSDAAAGDGGSNPGSSSGSTTTEKATDTTAAKDDAKPTAHTGKPLPSDWPAEVLVPYGEIIFILTNAADGSTLTVEGVDSDQAKGLISKMSDAGMQTTGPTDLDARSWTATAENGSYYATYTYDTGGSDGTPNVTMNLSKKM